MKAGGMKAGRMRAGGMSAASMTLLRRHAIAGIGLIAGLIIPARPAAAQPYIYTATSYSESRIAAFDAATAETVASRIVPGCLPMDVAFRPGRTDLFVACYT